MLILAVSIKTLVLWFENYPIRFLFAQNKYLTNSQLIRNRKYHFALRNGEALK